MSENTTSGRLVNIVTILVSLLTIGLLFSPAKFENEGMDFLLSILRGFKFDILFFLILMIVIWKFDSI
ncbi:MAG: hypothetical protein J7497_17390, partial [Chitinophagaceae bacterium]|nr:hypothetical protein [Chitinophagaceae bacterium]